MYSICNTVTDFITTDDVEMFKYNLEKLDKNEIDFNKIYYIITSIIIFNRKEMMKILLDNEISNIFFKNNNYLQTLSIFVKDLSYEQRKYIFLILIKDKRFEKNLNNIPDIIHFKDFYNKYFLKQTRTEKLLKLKN